MMLLFQDSRLFIKCEAGKLNCWGNIYARTYCDAVDSYN